MVVCFSVGAKSQTIINTLKATADNIEFETFSGVEELVKESKLRHIEYKRIVISSAIIKKPDKELSLLNSYIKEYNSNTEIVFIINESLVGKMDVTFKQYFDSPLYTPVIIKKGNSKSLLELVQSSILELNTKYYTLDVPKNQSSNEVAENINVSAPEVKVEEVPENMDKNVPVSSSGFGLGPMSVYTGNMESSSRPAVSVIEESSTDSLQGENSSVLGESGNFTTEDSASEDDELGIGEFGSQHSDTGWLDTDEDDELQAALNSKTKVETPKPQSRNNTSSISSSSESTYAEGDIRSTTNQGYSHKSQKVKTDLNIDLIISTRSVRATQAIIDESLDLYRKDDAQILIVDLDTNGNRILSYLQTQDFYRSSSFDGISKQRVYEEDNIGICSNGYGVPVTTKDLKALLSSSKVKKFDLILIDCPVDNLNIIDEEIISMCHVLLFTGGKKHDLIEMSTGITTRSIVKLEVEKYIMRECEVELVTDLDKEGVNFIKKSGMFANGCWLDRIDRV